MATAAAAILAKARRDVTDHFLSRNAVSRETAIGFEPARRVQRRMFDRLLKNEVLVEAGKGKWYVDVPRYQANSVTRRKRVLGAMGAVILVAVGAAIFG